MPYKNNLLIIILQIVFLVFLTYNSAVSQLDNSNVSAVKGGSVDTLAVQNAQKVVREAQGLLEKEVDPKTYMLGPNDELLVAVLGPKSKQFDLTISAEGKIFIPELGAINLKNKTLAEADELITQRVKKVYRAEEVSVFLKEIRKFKVIVGGTVKKPAIVPATAVERVSEVIDKAGGLKPDASLRKILLYRGENRQVIKVDLLKFFLTGEKDFNPTVLGGDYILVPPSGENETIQILGEVASPGKFEYTEGDSLSTLIRFGQGFKNTSLLDSVEIVRFSEDGSSYKKWIINCSSWKNIIQSSSQLEGDLGLKVGDRVFIREIPNWQKKFDVAIIGEVKFPGHYVIDEKTIRLSDLIERAGGFTEIASMEKSTLVRRAETGIYDREMERLWKLNTNEMSESEFQYFQARKSEVQGAMSIDFVKVLKDPKCDENVVLVNYDSVYVPARKLFVSIQGAVNKPGLITYKPELNYKDYVKLAGGYSYKADESSTLILKSKGEQFLAKDMNYKLEPGDNILVPPVKERLFSEAFTTFLTVATQIVTVLGVVIAILRLK